MNNPQSAPDELRFDCPACQATLIVPAAAAGVQGPCPICREEIIGPDPANQLLARLPAPPAPPPEPEPEPAPEPPPAEEPASVEESPSTEEPPTAEEPPKAEELPTVEEVLPHAESAPAPARRRSRAAIIAGLLVTAVVSGLIGYYIGNLTSKKPEIAGNSTPEEPVDQGTQQSTPPDLQPSPGPDNTVADPTSKPDPPAPDVAGSSGLAPEAALRAFLNAADWKQRANHVLWPDQVGPMMEKHAAGHGDGPISYQSIELMEDDGQNSFFQVLTEEIPEGFPVALITTDEGPKVEWETFVGFYEDHFRHFIDGPADTTGAFDLLIWPADPPDEGNSWRYQLRAPMPGRETVAYARKNYTASARLVALFNGADGIDKDSLKQFSRDGVPIALKLAKRSTADKRTYIEILEVISVGWISGAP